MHGKPKNKKMVWQQYIATLFFLLIGAVCGFGIGIVIGQNLEEEKTMMETVLTAAGLFVCMYAVIIVQIVIHEAGHLVFGLLSGYGFSSFRIFSLMWVKENKKICLRRLTVAGTGGQCLMTPPDMKDGRITVILYNLGGAFMNILAGTLFLILFFVLRNVPFLSSVLLFLAAIGYIFAVMNGVPMRMGTVDNDGYNAISLAGNPDAMRAFWVQLKTNEQIARGIRLKDMPEEWFTVPSDEAMKNSMAAAVGVFACNRLMDAQYFAKADAVMRHLLEIDSGIIGLHRNLMICDRMYCELITENRHEVLEEMLTKEQKKFMKSMKNFPSVLRTEYAYALLSEKDREKTEKIKAQFEKCAKTYPYPNEIHSERELMEIADRCKVCV